MKKFLSVILMLSMVLMLFSCTGNQVAQNETTKAENVAGDNTANTAEEDFSNYVIKSGRLTRNTMTAEELDSSWKKQTPDYNGKSVYYDDLNTGLLALDRGDIDLLVINASTVKYIMNQNPGKYSMINAKTNAYEEYSMSALDKNNDIIVKIDSVIKELDESGELWNIKLKNMEITNESSKSKMPHFDGADTYRVILTGDLPPMDYVNTNGEPVGFNVDLLTAIANKLKINFEIVTSNAASRFLMLTSDKADIAFWTLRASTLDKNSTNREALEVSVNNDNSKLTEYMNDVPEGIVTTRPYMIDQQGWLFLRGSKFERYLNLPKKSEAQFSDEYINIGSYKLNLKDGYSKVELTDDDKIEYVTEIYKNKDGNVLKIFSFDNNEKLSLEDFVNGRSKEHGGCIEDKTEEMGCRCILHTFAKNQNGKVQLVKSYHFKDGDKIVGYRIYNETKEVRLGNSDYYINIPLWYGDSENIDQRTVIEGAEASIYKSPDERFFPNISIWRWDENKCNYDDLKIRLKSLNVTCGVAESDYNNLANGGWTLDKWHKLLEMVYGENATDNLNGENEFGIDYSILEIIRMYNGEKIDIVKINVMDNEKLIQIELKQPQKYWKAFGEAIAQTIHKK